MALFDKVKDTVSMAGQDVAQKAKTATENVKLNNQIQSNEKMIQKLVYQVGVQCVNTHGMETGTEYDALFHEINKLRRENQELQGKIQELNEKKVCPQCGHANNMTAKFCTSCGAPIANIQAKEKPVGITCPKCGSANPDDALFCVECGSKLGDEENIQTETVEETDVTPVTEGGTNGQAVNPDAGEEETEKEE